MNSDGSRRVFPFSWKKIFPRTPGILVLKTYHPAPVLLASTWAQPAASISFIRYHIYSSFTWTAASIAWQSLLQWLCLCRLLFCLCSLPRFVCTGCLVTYTHRRTHTVAIWERDQMASASLYLQQRIESCFPSTRLNWTTFSSHKAKNRSWAIEDRENFRILFTV